MRGTSGSPGCLCQLDGKAVSCMSLRQGWARRLDVGECRGGKRHELVYSIYIPGIGESWLERCRGAPSLDEASSAPNDTFRPLPAEDRLRWCDGGLSWDEEDLAEFREEARLTAFVFSDRRASLPSGYYDYCCSSVAERLGKKRFRGTGVRASMWYVPFVVLSPRFGLRCASCVGL